MKHQLARLLALPFFAAAAVFFLYVHYRTWDCEPVAQMVPVLKNICWRDTWLWSVTILIAAPGVALWVWFDKAK